jgi:CYTH domain-containing protein
MVSINGVEIMIVKRSSLEIERKWIVQNPPDFIGLEREKVVQGYIAVSVDGTEVRLRQKGDQCFETIKTDGGLVRNEFEIELSRAQYDQLWPATEGRRIEKVRYEVRHGEVIIEIDEYEGELSGLLIAEVEVPSRKASALFNPPLWFGPEVTEERGYKNKNLAIKGLPSTLK